MRVASVERERLISRMREGAELHRIASEREGHYWMLMPDMERVASEVAEAVVNEACMAMDPAPVGRVSWKYEVRPSGHVEKRDVAQA